MIEPQAPSLFLAKVGTVAGATVKHVPTRMLLWGAIGLVVGVIGVTLSYVLGVLLLGRGALLLGYLVSIPIAIPMLGAVFFGIHGLHRGAARAALAIEEKFGLVAHGVDRVMTKLDQRFGERLANLPLLELEVALKAIVATTLKSKDEDEGKGLLAYILRRARKAIVPRIETYLLAAYRQEQQQDGSGGGLSMQKVRDRASHELSTRLGDLVMAPLNKQRTIFMILYVLLAVGWWFWLFLIIAATSRLAGHAGG
jgi:hypothetical protein